MNKKLVVEIVLLASLMLVGCSGNKRDKELREVFDAYVQGIKDYVQSSEYDVSGQIRYTLAYIDGDDDIPEMVLSEGSAHTSGVRIFFYDPVQKKAVDSGERYGELGGFSYYEKKSTIYDFVFGNGGYGNVSFCKITPNKVTRSPYFTYYCDADDVSHYYIDFTEVSQDDYDEKYAKYAPEFANEEPVTVERADMKGDYQACCSEDTVELFFEMMDSMK